MIDAAYVIGLGLSGCAAVEFLLDRGAIVYGYDDQPALLQRAEIAELIAKGMVLVAADRPPSSTQLVIVSPGVSPSHPVLRAAYKAGCEVIGEVELAFRFLKGRAIGITGTNGKTTVTLMTAHVLNGAGISALAVGNVGLPLTSQIDRLNAGQVAVVELSSFQLETTSTPVLDAAAFLNLSENHLDHHGSYEEYGRAKCRIQACLKRGAPLYIGYEAKLQCQGWLTSAHLRSFGRNSVSELYSDISAILVENQVDYILPLAYRRCNACRMDNLLAAYALCREMGVTPDLFFQALDSFRPLSHRQEWVGEWRGVGWVNDSKGTTPAATLAAVDALERPILLIAGGQPKGVSFREWAYRFPGRVRKLLLFGEAAYQIEEEVGRTIPAVQVSDLQRAVERAAEEAQAGELVLLSPGCASWDMFSSYVERGERFKEYVYLIHKNEGQEE